MTSAIVRLTLCLVLILVGVLLAADMVIGVSPNSAGVTLDARKKVTESMAVQASALASRNEISTLSLVMEEVVARNDDLLSAGLLHATGKVIVATPGHIGLWEGSNVEQSTPTHTRVEIMDGERAWGELQLRYTSLGSGWWSAWSPLLKLIGLCAVLAFAGYYVFLRRALAQLDPSSVVPGRVKATLDILTEGVVLVDKRERIVLANEAFVDRVGVAERELTGRRLSELAWHRRRADTSEEQLPWTLALNSAEGRTGATLAFPAAADDGHVSFVVNSSPILDDKGAPRGAIATFTDVTETERKNQQLQELLEEKRAAEVEILRQNQRLEILATRDSLTNCFNRRAFYERFNELLVQAQEDCTPLSCIMCDIDHFKSVNDNYGHSIGDDVIRFFADALNSGVRSIDIVGRYGGEEFCLVLPDQDVESGVNVAERLRAAMEQGGKSMLPPKADRLLTASFGVAQWRPGEDSADELVARADAALYRSKTGGRNRVTASSGMTADFEAEQASA